MTVIVNGLDELRHLGIRESEYREGHHGGDQQPTVLEIATAH